MSTCPKGRHAVFVGEIPRDFWPETIHHLPDRLQNVKLLERDLTLCEAVLLMRSHNSTQLARAIPGELWAFIAFHPRGSRP